MDLNITSMNGETPYYHTWQVSCFQVMLKLGNPKQKTTSASNKSLDNLEACCNKNKYLVSTDKCSREIYKDNTRGMVSWSKEELCVASCS